jgi:hypothetical protein
MLFSMDSMAFLGTDSEDYRAIYIPQPLTYVLLVVLRWGRFQVERMESMR